MTYPIIFIKDIFAPSKAREDLSKNSDDSLGGLITDMVVAILMMTTAGCALGHVGYLANLSEITSISMTVAAGTIIVVDWTLFTFKKYNPDTLSDELLIETPQPASTSKPFRDPIEAPKKEGLEVIQQRKLLDQAQFRLLAGKKYNMTQMTSNKLADVHKVGIHWELVAADVNQLSDLISEGQGKLGTLTADKLEEIANMSNIVYNHAQGIYAGMRASTAADPVVLFESLFR